MPYFAGGSLNASLIDEQCFRYEYDERGRMIMKKVPGAEVVYMVYDVRDRLVFSQDANMRNNNQWLTTLYDKLNRPVITGITTWAGTATDLQQIVTYQTTHGVVTGGQQISMTLSAPNTSGSYQALQSIAMVDGFSTATGAQFSAEIVPGSNGIPESTVEGMAISNNPIPDGASFSLLTKTGYDSYSDLPVQSNLSGTIDAYTSSNFSTSYSSFPYPEPIAQSLQTRWPGYLKQIKVLGTVDQYLYSVMIYDKNGRVIQIKTVNYSGAG